MYLDKMRKIEERIVRLREQIRRMEPSDEAYASLYEELAKWEESYPEFITTNSPTQKVITDFDGEITFSSSLQPDVIQEQGGLMDKLKNLNQPVFMQVLPKGIEVELHYAQGRFQYACTADDSAGVKDITTILAFSRDVPCFISYAEVLTIKGYLFYTRSFCECYPGIGLLNDDVNQEDKRNRRVMVRGDSSFNGDLSFLEKLGFLVPYHRLYDTDRLQEIVHECDMLYTYEAGYELEGVLLSAGGKELLYQPAISKSRLDGKTVVITGVLSKRRYDFRKDIEAIGGVLAGTVTKTVDFLLMGNNGTGTTKYQKAMKLGIPILTEEQFKEKYDVK